MLVLEAGRAERNYWSDLWHYRELFAILAWRDIAVRYKQTVIGIAWAVVRPVSDHGDLHGRIRPTRQTAERRNCALSGHGLRGHVAVVSVLEQF